MRKYIGTIDKKDADEFFSYTHRVGALKDLIKTLEQPAIPAELLEGVSLEKVKAEAAEFAKKKSEKFYELYDRHNWKEIAEPERIYLYETGKIYVYDKEEEVCEGDCCSK